MGWRIGEEKGFQDAGRDQCGKFFVHSVRASVLRVHEWCGGGEEMQMGWGGCSLEGRFELIGEGRRENKSPPAAGLHNVGE